MQKDWDAAESVRKMMEESGKGVYRGGMNKNGSFRGHRNRFSVHSAGKMLLLSAMTAADKAEWVSDLLAVCQGRIPERKSSIERSSSKSKLPPKLFDAHEKMPASPSHGNGESSMKELYSPMFSRKRGWMMKQGRLQKTWKRRYFALWNSSLLYYFKSIDDCESFFNSAMTNSKYKGYVDLTVATAVQRGERGKFEIVTPSRTWVFIPENEKQLDWWIEMVTKAMGIGRRRSKARRAFS